MAGLENMKKGSEPGTLAAKLGFRDGDLKTPEHDEMMLWLDSKLKDEAYRFEFLYGVNAFNGASPEWVNEMRRRAAIWVDSALEMLAEREAALPPMDPWEDVFDRRRAEIQEARGPLETWSPDALEPPDAPLPTLETLIWEKAIGDPRWIAGFIDLYAEIKDPYEFYVHWSLGRFGHDKDGYRTQGSIVLPEIRINWRTSVLAFEVKSRIPSLGDLIRQIRFYEEKLNGYPTPKFYVVGGKTDFAETLQGQGIGFVEYPSGKVMHPNK